MWKLIEHWLDTIIPKFEQEVGALQDFEQNQRDIKSEYPLFLEAIARTQSFLLGIVFARDLRREATGKATGLGQSRGKCGVAPTQSVDLEQ
jgi:hypothetical protein